MPKTEITADQVLAWIGSESSIEDCAEILADIANGKYKPKDLRQEVSDYNAD